MAQSQKTIVVRLPEETFRKFSNICNDERTSTTEVLREMINSFVDDEGVK